MTEKKKDRRGTPPGAGTQIGVSGRSKAGRIGNPPHVPTDAQRQEVLTLAKVASQEIIATVMGLSVDTLDRHYRKELDQGLAQAVVTVGAKLLQKAMTGHSPSINYFLSTRGKGSYSRRIEVTGANGGPVRTFDLSNTSSEIKRAMLADVDALIADAGFDEFGDDERTLN